MTVECGNEYSVTPAQFSDNCDQELDITSDFSSSNDGCTTIETYTWTATDHCNNSTTATTVVTIIDTTNPYFTSLPENATVNCDETIPGFGEYAAADNCDDQVEVMVEGSVEDVFSALGDTVSSTKDLFEGAFKEGIESAKKSTDDMSTSQNKFVELLNNHH
jgi:hypothetical protein